ARYQLCEFSTKTDIDVSAINAIDRLSSALTRLSSQLHQARTELEAVTRDRNSTFKEYEREIRELRADRDGWKQAAIDDAQRLNQRIVQLGAAERKAVGLSAELEAATGLLHETVYENDLGVVTTSPQWRKRRNEFLSRQKGETA